MKLIMDSKEYNLYELDSESELKEYVRVNEGLVVGQESQVKKKFYIADVMVKNAKKVIGILNEGHGILPCVNKCNYDEIIVVASDNRVNIFDMEKNLVIRSISCDSLIYDLIIRENERKIFIICELGIRCLTTTGEEVWTYDSDIISDFSFYDNYIELTIDDTVYKVCLLDGKQL